MEVIKLSLYILVITAFAGYIICPILAILSVIKILSWKITLICLFIWFLCQGITGLLIVIGGGRHD